MKIIDVENWERKSQFQNFSKYTHPAFAVGVRLDVTNLVLFCKRNNYSFFSAFLFIVAKCSNQVDEMKTRLEDDKVIQHDLVHPSFVVLRDDKCIATCLSPFEDDFRAFYQKTKTAIEQIKKETGTKAFNEQIRTDCLYISSLQWFDFTMVSNPYDFSDVAQTSIPRITWGKYVETAAGRYEMAFNIAAHHALMDGWHIAQLVGKIEAALTDAEQFLG